MKNMCLGAAVGGRVQPVALCYKEHIPNLLT